VSANSSGDTAALDLAALPEGLYRLTVDSAITDASGVALDGNGDGNSGDNYTVDFVSTAAGTYELSYNGTAFDPLIGGLGAGELVGGVTAGYGALNHLQVDGTDYAPAAPASATTTNYGETVVTPAETLAGLNVSRQITVPSSNTQSFARTVESLQNPTNTDITTAVELISSLGTAASANVFATSMGDATPSPSDQWVGTQSAGGPAIIHYIHGPGLAPTSVSVVGDNLEWSYNITVPAGATVELAELSIVNSTQAGAIADAQALVASTGFQGTAGQFLTSTDLAELANFQFVAPPVANVGGPYTYGAGGTLSLDGSPSTVGNGYSLNYDWNINGHDHAASGAQPTLSFAQLQALGITGQAGYSYTISLTVDDGHGDSSTASTDLSVVAGDPAQLTEVQPPSNDAVAGHTIPWFEVYVEDAAGNHITTDNSTVTMAVNTGPTGGALASGTFSEAASYGVATFQDLVIDKAGAYTLVASDGNLQTSVSGSFNITPDVSNQLAFENTTNNGIAGQTLPAFYVDVEDQYGNLETGDTSPVTLALATGPLDGSISAGTLTVNAASGVATFGDLAIDRAGSYTLSASDGTLASASSGSFTITHAAAEQLAFEATNNDAASAQTIPVFYVDVLDPYGNLVNEDASAVTISLNSDTAGGTLAGGTTTANALGGVATFGDLSILRHGNYSLTATDASLAPANSSAFSVGASLSLSTVSITPVSIPSGNTATVTLRAYDADGSPETNGGLAVTFGLANGTAGGTFGATTDNGDGTYTAVFTSGHVGDNTITASINGGAVTSTQPSIKVTQPPFDLGESTVTLDPASVASGNATTLTLHVRDANGVPDTNSGLTVAFQLGAGAATGTFGNVVNNLDGTYTVAFTGILAGTNTITATINGPALTSTTPTVTVTAGPASLSQSTLSVSPTQIATGDSVTVTLKTTDANGNNDTTGGLDVSFGLSNDSTGTGSFDYTIDNGDGTYTTTFYSESGGTDTIIAYLNGQAVTSSSPIVTVEDPPSITASPHNVSALAGTPVTLSAAATGTGLSVQWQVSTDGLNFSDIPGANNPSYVFVADPAQSGDIFQAVFTNAAGSATSMPAFLTVLVVPPVALTSPVSVTAGVGESVTFTAIARGFPAPAVQWQTSVDGGHTFTDIPGATSASYAFTAAASQTKTQFRAVFTNVSGIAMSKAATLTVSGAVPTVITSPVSQAVAAGAAVTFAATASGSPTPVAHWQVSVDGGNTFTTISSAAKLSLKAQPANNGYQYRVMYSNKYGVTYTGPATLTVLSAPTTPPVVTTQPTAPTTALNPGLHVTLKVAATGAAAVQWQMSSDGVNFTDIAGATKTTYTLTTQSAQNGYQYRAVFINPFGQTPSNAAAVAVNPTVTLQPVSKVVYAGQPVTFTAAALGNPPATVQWQVGRDGKNFSNIAGATSTTLMLTPALADSGLHYRAVFTCAMGASQVQASSKVTTLTVHAVPTRPTILVQPVGQTVAAGQTVTFTAMAIANTPLTVLWMVLPKGAKAFVPVPGATSPTLTFIAQPSDNGSKYRAMFINSAGTATTTMVTLTLEVPPFINLEPFDQVVVSGKAVFSAAATGSPAKVQWQVSTDGGHTYTNLKGATSTKLNVVVQPSLNGDLYRAVFTNPVGQAVTGPGHSHHDAGVARRSIIAFSDVSIGGFDGSPRDTGE
jgi:hypothetical protein